MEPRSFFFIFYLHFLLFHLPIADCSLSINPKVVHVKEGERIEVNCTSDEQSGSFYLQWKLLEGGYHTTSFSQKMVSKNVVTLVIPEAHAQHSGKYACFLTDHHVIASAYEALQIQVGKSDDSHHESLSVQEDCKLFFRCSSDIQISCRYRCDGNRNCPNGEDEANCAKITSQQKNNGNLKAIWATVKTTVPNVGFVRDKSVALESRPVQSRLDSNEARFFYCDEQFRVPSELMCDGNVDCPQGEDELFCHRRDGSLVPHKADTVPNPHAKFEQCKGLVFYCYSSAAVLLRVGCELTCDGKVDCPKGEDEVDCPGKELKDLAMWGMQSDGPRKSGCKGDTFFCGLIKIDCIYRCDGLVNCPNGEDEKGCPGDPCEASFRCNNSRCIDYKYVCDNVNHCEDWSDEDRCPPFTVTTGTFLKENTADEDQMVWLKTTVYTVIACTVGIVLLISVVVIAIFRVKMKRAAVRRALRQAERRRRHGHRCEGQGSRSNRSEPVEHEPFISAPSPTHFGNIIVNVNNGVQYVPNSDFRVGIQSPPTYSDVLAESGILGRHSPPPEYSTIDRNPNRVSLSPDSELHIQSVCEVRSERNNESHLESSSVDNIQTASNMEDIQPSPSVQQNEPVVPNSANNSTTACSRRVTNRDGTSSLGRRPQNSHDNRHSRNVRSVASPRRPKQLKVRDGQIVLDDSSSNSSSPETVNRNTQTNPADIPTPNQNTVKPAQIQVQAGQIILANDAQENGRSRTESSSETEGAASQGQLDVKDGHIVFKPTGS